MSQLNSYRASCLKEMRVVCDAELAGPSCRPPGPALSDVAVGMAPSFEGLVFFALGTMPGSF